MNDRSFRGRRTWILAMVLGVAGVVMPAAPAAAQPVLASELVQAALQGFGDRHNSHCVGRLVVAQQALHRDGPRHPLRAAGDARVLPPGQRRLPADPGGLACTQDAHDLPLAAEIWRWTPETDTWEMLYRSPVDVPIQGTSRKYALRDIGYRACWYSGRRTARRRSTSPGSARAATRARLQRPRAAAANPALVDGRRSSPRPRTRARCWATSAERLPHPGDLQGQDVRPRPPLGLLGHGVVFEAAHPEQGNNAFRADQPPGQDLLRDLQTYNGHLYAGTGVQPVYDPTPWSLSKTDATGDPYTFSLVIPEGAYRSRPRRGRDQHAGVQGNAVRRHRTRAAPREPRRQLGPGGRARRARPRTADGWSRSAASISASTTPSTSTCGGWPNTTGRCWWGRTTSARSPRRPRRQPVPEPHGRGHYATADGWNFSMVSRNGASATSSTTVPHLHQDALRALPGTANHCYGTKVFRGVPAPRPIAAPQGPGWRTSRTRSCSPGGPAGATRYRVFRDTGFEDPVEIAGVHATAAPVQTYLDSTTDGFASVSLLRGGRRRARPALRALGDDAGPVLRPCADVHVPALPLSSRGARRRGLERCCGPRQARSRPVDFDQAWACWTTLRGACWRISPPPAPAHRTGRTCSGRFRRRDRAGHGRRAARRKLLRCHMTDAPAARPAQATARTLPTWGGSRCGLPPVFIIGSARSGTTILYQLLAHMTGRFNWVSPYHTWSTRRAARQPPAGRTVRRRGAGRAFPAAGHRRARVRRASRSPRTSPRNTASRSPTDPAMQLTPRTLPRFLELCRKVQ